MIEELMWTFHDYVVNFRPLFYIGGVMLTIIILVLMLLEETNNGKKK